MSFITRPFHCEGQHKRATRYIVWGGTRQHLIIYTVTRPIISNITPHIVSYADNVINGKIEIACTCGVIGCGIDFKDPKDIQSGIIFHDVKLFSLPIKEFEALFTFVRTGYELSKFKR